MPYAANGQISQSPIEGGIEITAEQYQQALEGMLRGEVVSIGGGFSVGPPPEPEKEPEPEPLTPEEGLAQWRQSASVTPRQARLALLQASLLSQVDDAIASLETPERETAQIEWEYATTVERGSAWVASLGAALGLSEMEIDQLFIDAAKL